LDRLVKSSELSPHTVSGVGVAIHEKLSHVGVLYRTSEGQAARVLHLAWHNQLKSDLPSPNYPYWVRPWIPEDRALVVAAFCRLIWRRANNAQVPYGFSRPSDFFDRSGDLISGPTKVGLTCASFVLAVFDGAGLPLVYLDDWPKATPADKAKQEELLNQLRRDSSVAPDHVSALELEVGNIRYHPLEVAGAATAKELPASHAYASQMAVKIQDLINGLSVGTERVNDFETSGGIN
jgi:hypothetical protein